VNLITACVFVSVLLLDPNIYSIVLVNVVVGVTSYFAVVVPLSSVLEETSDADEKLIANLEELPTPSNPIILESSVVPEISNETLLIVD
tara:strand:+ start:567 stop:833 length:267 start_codon:yes stop_codon:yes gene_type:complete